MKLCSSDNHYTTAPLLFPVLLKCICCYTLRVWSIVAVGGKVWKQTGPIMVCLNECIFENSWAKFPFTAALEVPGCPVCSLIAQTGIYSGMYFPLYKITPNFLQDFN